MGFDCIGLGWSGLDLDLDWVGRWSGFHWIELKLIELDKVGFKLGLGSLRIRSDWSRNKLKRFGLDWIKLDNIRMD